MDFASISTESWIKIIGAFAGAFVALAGLLVGGFQFAKTQAITVARPFLERKLKWCEEAVETAAGIAVHGRDSTLEPEHGSLQVRRVDRFWALYWGPMGMVENEDITQAMIEFGNGLKFGQANSDNVRALKLAHACRNEMARDWSPIWRR